MQSSSLALFINIGFCFFYFLFYFLGSFVSALWWEWYRYGVCSSTAELTECDWKILWTCIYLGMIFYHTVLLLMIHYHHHHFLRIILWFWEWKNSGYTLIYYYYYYYNMFLDHVFMSLWPFSSHGVFIFLPI